MAANKRMLARYIAPGPDDTMMLDGVGGLLDAYWAQTADVIGLIDLCVHGLEAGSDAISAYGSLFSAFYDTLAEIACRCVELLGTVAGDQAMQFLPRLEAVQSVANTADYGYGGVLCEVLSEVYFWGEE